MQAIFDFLFFWKLSRSVPIPAVSRTRQTDQEPVSDFWDQVDTHYAHDKSLFGFIRE